MDSFRPILALALLCMFAVLANALHWTVLRVRGIRCEKSKHSGWRRWACPAGLGLLGLGAVLALTHLIPSDWFGIYLLLLATVHHTDDLLLRCFVAERRRTA